MSPEAISDPIYLVPWHYLPPMPTMSPEAISDPIYLVPWPYLPPMPTMSPEAESDPLPFLSTLSPDPIYPLYLPCPPILFIPYPCHVPWPYLPPTSVMSPDPFYPLPPPCISLDPVPFRHNNVKESVGGKPCSQEYARCNHHMRVWINLPASGACNDQ